MNRINWTRKAVKQLQRIAREDQTKIYDAAQELAHMPHVQQVRVLIRHQYGYRLRVGKYRVLFDWGGSINIVKKTLNNYLRCQDCVKNRLKMLIYYQ